MRTRFSILLAACFFSFPAFLLACEVETGDENAEAWDANVEISGDEPDGGDAGPAVTAEQFPMSWTLELGLTLGRPDVLGAIAPDVQQMTDGTYRMYYKVTGQGIGSAISSDGLAWEAEEGLRILDLRHQGYDEGVAGWEVGHPWLVPLDDGTWRMYLQLSAGIDEPCEIGSATSRDGFDFEMENGVRVAIGADSGPPALSFAGHGRSWEMPDGSWATVFSGNLLNDYSPSDIMLATSPDGLEWQVIETCLFDRGHDPSVIELTDGRLAMVFAYLRESLRVALSDDHGMTWSAAEVLTLTDPTGDPVSDIGADVDLYRLPDGTLRMLTNSDGGIGSYVPAGE